MTTTAARQPLTERQQQILAFIRECIGRDYLPPTVREIGAQFGIKSPNGVMANLKALARKGHITLAGTFARAIRLTVPMALVERSLLAECLPHLPGELAGRVREAMGVAAEG